MKNRKKDQKNGKISDRYERNEYTVFTCFYLSGQSSNMGLVL